jgi:hypothetical protein
LLLHSWRTHGLEPVSLITRELELVDTLDVGGVPRGMQHDIGPQGIALVVGEDGAVALGVTFVTRLPGEVAAKLLREALLDAGEGGRMLQEAKLLGELEGIPLVVDSHEPVTLRIVSSPPERAESQLAPASPRCSG